MIKIRKDSKRKIMNKFYYDELEIIEKISSRKKIV